MSRQEILEQLADNHEAQLKKTLQNLEEEILSSISRATGGSELISTRIAIELRKDIKAESKKARDSFKASAKKYKKK